MSQTEKADSTFKTDCTKRGAHSRDGGSESKKASQISVNMIQFCRIWAGKLVVDLRGMLEGS